jgi:ribonuclease P protein component
VKKKFRLTRPTDFQRVRRQGKSYAHPLVVLIALENDTEQIRIGVTAGKTLGSAVKRNRAKRLLRAAIAPLLPHITPGVDLALVARKPILDVKSTQVQDALAKNLRKAKLLKNNHDR